MAAVRWMRAQVRRNHALYSMPGSPFTNIAHLKGARIGVNAPNNIGSLLISSVLAEYGL